MFKKLLAALLASTMLISSVPVYAAETTDSEVKLESIDQQLNTGEDGERASLSKRDIQTFKFADDVYDEGEPNNSLNNAPIMENNYTVVGELSGSDLDIFAFHLNERNYVEFYLLTDTPGCVGGLYRENGTLIQQFDDGGNKRNENGHYENTLFFELPANSSPDAYYYVGVQEVNKAYTTYALYYNYSPFFDVIYDDYFFEPVLWANNNGITTGTGVGRFEPNATCTRGQIVTFLWRAAGSPTPKTTKNPFTDIKSSDYFYNAVLWAVEKGITNGISNTKFGPNQGCTRGQVVTFLHRAALTPSPSSGGKSFKDVSSNEFYYNPVRWAVQKGITQGTSDTKFSPNDTCTRGQIVTFLYRGNNVINWDALNKHSATTDKISTTRLTKSSNGKYSAYVLNASGDTITKITIEEKYYFDQLGYTQAQINQLPSISQANKDKYSSIKGFTYTDTLTSYYYELKLSIDATNKDALLKANELGLISLSGGATNLSLSQSVENIKKAGYVVSHTS